MRAQTPKRPARPPALAAWPPPRLLGVAARCITSLPPPSPLAWLSVCACRYEGIVEEDGDGVHDGDLYRGEGEVTGKMRLGF